MSGYLFMGEQEDPELDVLVARGGTRVYDATRERTEAETRLLADWAAKRREAHRARVLELSRRCKCDFCEVAP